MDPRELAARLGIEGDVPHLGEALTHPSFANEIRRAPRVDYQRLEFLGDSVLGLCVTELLMALRPFADEGELSLLRASLVSTDALAAWARAADLGAALRLGRGAAAARERAQKNLLPPAGEAIVGAGYRHSGLEAARALSRAVVAEPLSRIEAGGAVGRDPKSELQERIQAAGRSSPRYRVVETRGPDHAREFVVEVFVEDEVLGVGHGRSKKLAEQAAAQAAILAEPPEREPPT